MRGGAEIVNPLGRVGRFSVSPVAQRVYLEIVRHFDATGHIPTHRDIASRLGISAGRQSLEAIQQLRDCNWIDISGRGRKRSVILLEPVLRHLKPAALHTHATPTRKNGGVFSTSPQGGGEA
ncbi:MAG: hypothetical protein Q8K13_10475 [Parvibaculum sp.]|uniref:hypothetical protein n=1 Tax=Parvibaculum sp. TaxID=2024848 RepID=UPI002731DD60|nr:hypothetical protein [Parvibaculum sp.]MDP2150053.1 hypothetical protein [Parvibaculum sp.]